MQLVDLQQWLQQDAGSSHEKNGDTHPEQSVINPRRAARVKNGDTHPEQSVIFSGIRTQDTLRPRQHYPGILSTKPQGSSVGWEHVL